MIMKTLPPIHHGEENKKLKMRWKAKKKILNEMFGNN